MSARPRRAAAPALALALRDQPAWRRSLLLVSRTRPRSGAEFGLSLTPPPVISGAEGAVFAKSVETPHVRAEPFKELRLESPTRSLLMEAPKGIQILAEAGDIQAICRNELRLESKDGEISLDARRIRLMRLPEGKAAAASSSSGTRQSVYEVCVCPNGRLFLSQAGTGSTCQISNNVCL
ncbi:unnamed protein product [Tetraodon nigroviridis]|uniref:(spotted green pufferfish) hypothetical protein n=1 Tax=Tetraodon nigroviridis TaxID=99883 RepID=Q4SPZ9_TETNG|nr:unnamed protein product [Tetraodon nigroviridis]